MTINFEKFREWAESRFDDVIIKGDEIRLNSIFASSDDNHHLWCSPSGGKKGRDFGVYHCFKTDKKGSLLGLVRLVDKCSKDDAMSTLLGYDTISQLEKRLDEFLNEQEDADQVEHVPVASKIPLPSGCALISELGTNNWYRRKSEDYLLNRKIPIDGYYVCMEAPYKSRIVIPYYGRSGEIIYWNSRHMNPKARLRYLGPPKECGVGKEDVIYMASGWPSQGSVLHLCEGEFNAKSLHLSDLRAAACGGKNMSEKQAIALSEYRVVVCLDRDKAGTQGTMKMLNMLSLSKRLGANDKLVFVRPPEQFNDWNEMYVDAGPAVVNRWIQTRKKPVDFQAPNGMAGDAIGYL